MIGRHKSAKAEDVLVEAATTPRTSAIIAADAAAARETLAAQEDAVLTAQAAYEASLDLGRAEALAAREHLRGAEVDRDIARRAAAKLEAERGLALESERRAEVSRVIAAADAAQEEYRQAVVDLVPEMGRVARALIRFWAQAEIANEAAVVAIRNEAGEDAARQRPGVEAFRTWAGRPREPLRPPVERSLWTNAAGAAPGDDWQARIREQPDGSGILLGQGGRTVFEHRRTFREETFLPAEAARAAAPLVTTLNIPVITAVDRAGWSPLDYADPRRALALLDELEKAAPLIEDRRQPKTEVNPVGLAVKVSRSAASLRE